MAPKNHVKIIRNRGTGQIIRREYEIGCNRINITFNNYYTRSSLRIIAHERKINKLYKSIDSDTYDRELYESEKEIMDDIESYERDIDFYSKKFTGTKEQKVRQCYRAIKYEMSRNMLNNRYNFPIFTTAELHKELDTLLSIRPKIDFN